MNPFIALVFLALLVSGCVRQKELDGGALTSINIIDRNGFSETISSTDRLTDYEDIDFLADQPYQKVLRVYHRDAAGDVRAYITSYHPNGQPKQYLEVVNGRAYGTYQEWYPSGQMKLETTIVGGEADLNTCAEKSWLFDGISRVWEEDGALKAEIPYVKGVLEGTSIYYHCNGSVWKRSPFCNGTMEGVFEVYLENGELLQSTTYAGGFKNGSSTRYWPGGAIASEEMYSQDLLITGRYMDRTGKVVAQIDNGNGQRAVFGKDSITELQEYHQGIPEGVLSVFGKNQILIREYHLKDALKNGEEIEYYPPTKTNSKPQPKLSVNWYQGVIQGVVKTWYPNGILESKREMSGNKKNGVSTAWYRDGSLMLIEEYEQDKIVRGEYYKIGEKFPISQVVSGKGTATIYDADGNFLRKTTYVNGKPGEVLPD